MAEEIKILTSHQEEFLSLFGAEKQLTALFYFTGGTPLSAFYLFHRLSEDIDLFSEDEINLLAVRNFIGKAQKKLSLLKIDYKQY